MLSPLLRAALDEWTRSAPFLTVVRALQRLLGRPQSSYFEAYYKRWVQENAPGPDERARMRAEGEAMKGGPLVSVVTPVYDVDERWLRACIDSVRNQAYPRWELCLVDDASPRPHVLRVLEEQAQQDPRIHFRRRARNGGIVAASNDALSMARGEYVALLDHDDELAPEALLEVARRIQADPGLDVIYSDEDKINPRGHRVQAFFKPGWSPELLRSMNYVSHLGVYRRELVERIGGFRDGFEGSQDYDLVLRVTEQTDRIAHVPSVLYHWRQVPGSTSASGGAKPYAYDAARRALAESLARRGETADVVALGTGRYRVRYAIQGSPTVTVLVVSGGDARAVGTCLAAVERTCGGRSVEVLVVDRGGQDPAALLGFHDPARGRRVIRDASPSRGSAIRNRAAAGAAGEFLLFLDEHVEALAPGWLDALLEHAQRPGIGAVGPKLVDPRGAVTSAGLVMGLGGPAGGLFAGRPGNWPLYFDLAGVVREVSAVPGGCMLVSRRHFDLVGGFDETFAGAHGNLDFCIRLRQRGLRNIFTGHAVLRSREDTVAASPGAREDEARWREKWGSLLGPDEYYNPNLSLQHADPLPRLERGSAPTFARHTGRPATPRDGR